MSDLRTDAYAAGYYIDPGTRQVKAGTYNACLIDALFRQRAAENRTDKITVQALRKIGNVLQEMESCRSGC